MKTGNDKKKISEKEFNKLLNKLRNSLIGIYKLQIYENLANFFRKK